EGQKTAIVQKSLEGAQFPAGADVQQSDRAVYAVEGRQSAVRRHSHVIAREHVTPADGILELLPFATGVQVPEAHRAVGVEGGDSVSAVRWEGRAVAKSHRPRQRQRVGAGGGVPEVETATRRGGQGTTVGGESQVNHPGRLLPVGQRLTGGRI